MTSDSSFPAIELRGIRRFFASRVVLDRIDLTIARGEVTVLVGPSGSGKSTLLKIVAGIDHPDEGSIWLSGRDCTLVPPHRRPVHTVFQNYALFPHLDVAGNVGFPLSVAGVPKADRERRVKEALKWVQLENFFSRRIEALSGGEKQRVALARALVNQPECVLLDEPLSALDPHLRAHTLELLRDIQSRLGMTYLYITHDREEALRLADRVGVLNAGRLEQIGRPEHLYRQPATRFVASFLGKMNWLPATRIAPDKARLAAGPIVPLPTSDPQQSCRNQEALEIGVRPEDVTIEKSQRTNGLHAKVESRQFSGSETSLRLRLHDGTMITAELRGDAPQYHPGTEVECSWPADALHVFPAAPAPATAADGSDGR